MEVLTPRWTPLKRHSEQSKCFRSRARFNINHSGRRSGKTELEKRKMAQKALKGGEFGDWRGFVAAPTRAQAKRIYWSDMKMLIPRSLYSREPDESNLIIYCYPNSQLHVLGMDRPERIEGTPWDDGLLDEYGNMKERTWQEHVRPALSDRRGRCTFIGVPEGRNHYFDLVEMAKEDRTGAWAVWHWPSSEVLEQEEIDAAKRDMDEIVFHQEYGGEFVTFTGRAYYNFDEKIHVGKYRHLYNKELPLVLCFDFNVSPGVAVIAQEYGRKVFDIKSDIQTISTIIAEVYIPRQSNTVRVCRKIIEKFGDHQGLVICYGDSTGGAKGTAKLRGSDWDIIKQELYPYFGDRLYFKVPMQNPRERQRVNALNSRLLSYSGEVKLVIDGNCVKLIKDLNGVRVIEGSAGEIDKDSDPLLSHISDALGYYVHREFPIGGFYTREDVAAIMKNKRKIDEAMRKAA